MTKSVPTTKRPTAGRVLPDLSQHPDTHAERIQVFDPEAIRSALQSFDNVEDWSEWSPENSQRAAEDVEWRRVLKTLVDDPLHGQRDVFKCDEAACARIDELKTTIPHMRTAIEIVGRAARMSSLTNTRLRLPPICLVGPPGTSKSYFARCCLDALGVHQVRIDVSMMNERGKLTGYSRSWRGARIGALASAVVDRRNKTACAAFFLDEIDKSDPRERVADILLSAMEPENACRFVDEYVTDIAPLRLDHACFILAANDASLIPQPVLDRTIVIEVDRPTGDASDAVLLSILREAIADVSGYLKPHIERQSIVALRELTPRKMRQVFDLAIPMAIAAGKRHIEQTEITQALNLIGSPAKWPPGFFRSQIQQDIT